MRFKNSLNSLLNDPGDFSWRGFVLRWMFLSLVLHLVTAFFSLGHHSADEYFQILEFMNYKLGRTPRADLAVEFAETMRPWLQPGIYYVMAKTWLAIGFDNPFGWAVTFRSFAGLLGWLSTLGMAAASRFWFVDPKARRWVVVLLALIWFFPALHVRPSSESLAGSSFLIGLTLAELLRNLKVRGIMGWIIAGAFFGLSFESRFQMGFMIVGAFAWLLLVGKVGARALASAIAGFFAVFLMGRLVDSWGYGQWVFSPWNYVSYNLVRGEVNRYTHLPWWDFLRMSFTESWPFLGTVVAVGTLIAWVRQPLSILTWSGVPFFLIHELIAHKELRFFFPIAMAAPVLLVFAIYDKKNQKLSPWAEWVGDSLMRWPRSPAWARYFGAPFWYFLVINNLIALVALAFLPFARNVQFYQDLSREIQKTGAERFELYTQERDPFEVLGSNTYFYRPKNLLVIKASYPEMKMALEQKGMLWIFEPRFEFPGEEHTLRQACRPVFRTLPDWIKKIDFGGWVARAQVWTLFECRADLK